MDTGTLHRGLTATLGGTDHDAVTHLLKAYDLICRKEEFGCPSWGLAAAFVTLIPTANPRF